MHARLMSIAGTVGMAAWLATVTLGARQAPTPIDVQKLGPKIGDAVPGFTLTDQAGAQRSLKSLLGPSGGLLVFFRSADW